MNIFPPIDKSKNNTIGNKIDTSIVYSKNVLFSADYIDNGEFSVCLKRNDLHIGYFKKVCGRWVYIDDFASKWLTNSEWDSLKMFLQEFSEVKN